MRLSEISLCSCGGPEATNLKIVSVRRIVNQVVDHRSLVSPSK